jgi:tetratricopeptide (TPR) repeat protein
LLHRVHPGPAARFILAAALSLGLFVAGGAPGSAKGTPAASPSPEASPAPTPEPPNIAIPKLEQRLKDNPNDLDAMAQLAPYYMDVRRPDLAMPLIQKLLASGRKTGQIYFLAGMADEQLGRGKEATADLEQAANYEPTNSQILLALTQLYLQTNRAADADRVAKRAITFNKEDPRAFETYGLVLAQEGKYDDARAQFEVAAKLDPKGTQALDLIGRSYIDQKAYPNALQAFDRALALDPKDGEALQGKAAAYLGQNDIKNVIATYDQLYANAPNDDARIAVLAAEAHIFVNAKQTSEAERVLQKAVTTFPANPMGHIEYGDFLASQNRPKEAEAQWIAAAGPNNDNREALLRLGTFYLQQNNKPKAIAEFKRATELRAGDAEALIRLGQAYSANAQYSEARDAYKRSFEAQQSVIALAGVGVSDCALKNYKEGTQIFDAINKNAAPFAKANPQLYLVMGQCYADAGQKQKAKDAYAQLLPLTKSGSAEQAQVRKLISNVDKPQSGSKPAPSPTPKH